MAAKPEKSTDAQKLSKGNRLPFEPGKGKQRQKTPAKAPVAAKGSSSSTTSTTAAGIPKVVSDRMVRRMFFFCGIPSLSGLLALPAAYLVVSHHWFDLPNYAVLLVSFGLFGLGVLGLSYGALSASWDDEPGSKLGWSEFQLNWGRMVSSWKSQQSNKST